jgi:hypothetical protein
LRIRTVLLIAGIVFFALSCLIAIGNMAISVSRYVRKRKGLPDGRQSLVHVLSIVFSIMAYSTAGNTLGPWVFIPAIVDPATLFILAAPFLLRRMRRQAQSERKGP